MQVNFAFGKDGLSLELPEGFEYRVLEARSAEPLPDSAKALDDALDAPIGSPALTELARKASSVAISVCDVTRPVPNAFVLPPLLKRLEAGGIARDKITILIATGLHRGATAEEIHQILGEEIAAAYRVENHDARNLASHRLLGKTSTGTPVYIDERFVTAGLKITLGFLEPHLMLGYSGGRKLVAPGLAAQDTIKVLHSPKFMSHPRSFEGSIENNPLHVELLEIARMAGHKFMVDVSLTRSRRIAGIFAGDPVQAHARGVAFVSQAMLQTLDEPADAVITTSAGHPLDLTFYQAIKGVSAAQNVVKQGGRILVMAACAEGSGAAEFSQMLKEFPSPDKFIEKLAASEVIVDQWQLEKLSVATRKADIHYYVPGLPADYYPSLWGTAYASPEAALAGVTEGLSPGAKIAVIPDGPYVLARARDTQGAPA